MRPYDLLLYGATGFTGRQAALYLAKHAPADLKVALAGRSESKLKAIAESCGRPVGIVVADSSHPDSIDAMSACTRVLLSTVGPYAQYGDPVVDACVRHQTHYADITGETPWVRRVIERHHQQAVESGVRIVPFSGFDSVPPDLGCWMMVQAIRERYQVDVAEISSYCVLSGGFNGGTLASALGLVDETEMENPKVLDVPGQSLPVVPPISRVSWNDDFKAWTAPFFMTPVNAAVVRRSAGLFSASGRGYGPQFRYHEAWGSRSRLKALSLWLGVIGSTPILKSSAGRWLARRFGPAPGEGPSEATMDAGYFRYQFIAKTEDGRSLRGVFGDKGDPGNRVTVKCLCETGFALTSVEVTPGAGGVLTPAFALGKELLTRLQTAGMDIRVTDS